jgi:hypothetical protein
MPETINLKDGQTAVVGYGSLLSRPSVSRTLAREYDGPFVACHLEGWHRSWDASMPNQAFYFAEGDHRNYPERILYLNIRPQPETLLNVVVFVTERSELEAMHGREWIYEPTVITSSLRGLRVEGGDAIAYVCRHEHVVRGASGPLEAAVRRSYLRIVETALASVGEEFRDEYRRTTDVAPEHLLIDDVLDPERPSPWAGHGYRPEKQIG